MESFETQESAAGQKEFDKVSVASLVLVLLAFCSALLPMTDSGPPSLFVAFLIFYFPGGVCGIWGLIRTKKKCSFARKKFGHDDSSYRQPDITLDHRYFPLLFSGHTKRRLLLAGPALEQLVEGSPSL